MFALVAVLFDGPFVGVIRLDLFSLDFTGVLFFIFIGLLLFFFAYRAASLFFYKIS